MIPWECLRKLCVVVVIIKKLATNIMCVTQMGTNGEILGAGSSQTLKRF
jgi:hypothetical protein